MPLMILSILIQLLLVVHIFKTGRNTTWIWVVIAIPMVGSLAYVVVEILPSFLNSYKGKEAQKSMVKILNPEKEFNDAMQNYEIANTVKHTTDLADACMNKDMFQEAQKLYTQALNGIYKYDVHLLLGLAQAEFELAHYDEVKSTLNLLMEKNPDYENVDTHLLYARALEGLEEYQSALEVYEALETYSPGPEALFRYAMLHRKLGNEEATITILQQILRVAKISGDHHNKIFKEWIKKAKQEIQ